jgi:hypothetical protein
LLNFRVRYIVVVDHQLAHANCRLSPSGLRLPLQGCAPQRFVHCVSVCSPNNLRNLAIWAITQMGSCRSVEGGSCGEHERQARNPYPPVHLCLEQASMTSAPPQRMHASRYAAFGCGITLGGRLFCCFPGRDGGARNPRFPFYRDSAPAAELASWHVSTGLRRRALGMLTLGGSSLVGVPAA